MPGTTTNLGLATYNVADGGERFLNFRIAIAGSQETSNMWLIDTAVGANTAAITELQNKSSLTLANAIYVLDNYYEATVFNFERYIANEAIVFSLDRTNIGAVTIKINQLATRQVVKYNEQGNLVPLGSGDWKINKKYLVINEGDDWVWVGGTSGDQISISGTPANVTQISSSNTLEDSGRGFGTANGIATLDANSILVEYAKNISDNAVGTNQLQDLSVTTDKIADGAITLDKIDPSAQGIAPATATYSAGVVAITAPDAVKIFMFTAPSDFLPTDTYTLNGTAMTLVNTNGKPVLSGWVGGARVIIAVNDGGTVGYYFYNGYDDAKNPTSATDNTMWTANKTKSLTVIPPNTVGNTNEVNLIDYTIEQLNGALAIALAIEVGVQ